MRPTPESEFRHGWPAALGCFCVAVFAWGFGFYGLSVYIAALHRQFGWSTAVIGAAASLYYLCGALLMPFVHALLRRSGPRVLMLCGIFLLGVGAAGFRAAFAPWQLFVFGPVMAMGWATTSSVAIASTLALWFDQRRGFAISLALNGASASGFTVAPLLLYLDATFMPGLAVPAAVLVGWALLIPIILICFRRPHRAPAVSAVARPAAAGAGPAAASRAGLLSGWDFWSIALPFALATAAQVGFIVHMVALLLPRFGTAGTSLAVTTSSLAAMLGRLALGAVIDRLPRRPTSAACILSQACGLLLVFGFPRSMLVGNLGILLFGLSVGNVITFPALLVQAEFDAASFGLVIGLSGAIVQFTLAFAPGLFGVLRDITGGYDVVLLVCIGLQIAAAALVLLPAKRRRPMRACESVS